MAENSGVFELPITIHPDDIDQLGHVNNVVYLRWVQETAVAHWKAVAPPAEQDALLWVVLRHEIDYRQPAFLGDEVLGRTWVGTVTKIRFQRHTEIIRAHDRRVLAKAVTIWCPISTQTGRPVMVSAEIRQLFSIASPD
jgi:acyl-CoA thioester hydrolase